MFRPRITTRVSLQNNNCWTTCLKFANGREIRTDRGQFRMFFRAGSNIQSNWYSPLSSNSMRHSWKTDSAIMSFKGYLRKEQKSKRKNCFKPSKERYSTYQNTATAVEWYRRPYNTFMVNSNFSNNFSKKYIPIRCTLLKAKTATMSFRNAVKFSARNPLKR